MVSIPVLRSFHRAKLQTGPSRHPPAAACLAASRGSWARSGGCAPGPSSRCCGGSLDTQQVHPASTWTPKLPSIFLLVSLVSFNGKNMDGLWGIPILRETPLNHSCLVTCLVAVHVSFLLASYVNHIPKQAKTTIHIHGQLNLPKLCWIAHADLTREAIFIHSHRGGGANNQSKPMPCFQN